MNITNHLRGVAFCRRVFFCAVLLGFRTLVSGEVPSGPAVQIKPQPGGFIQLTWPVSDKGYELEIADDIPSTNWTVVDEDQVRVGDLVTVRVPFGTEARFFRLREVELPLVEVISSSPIPGDASVAVTRETVVRFSGPLHPDTVVTSVHYFARMGGDELPARIHLSHDRRSATLFYAEDLPGNVRVDVVFDGTGLKDELGRVIDPDGDGQPGGSLAFHFNTLGFLGLEGTSVAGRVYASAKGEGDVDLPLEGVTVTVDGMESTLKAITNADGEFLLNPSPAGRFFVHIDGRTMADSQWPEGEYYPFVGKAWEAKAGRVNDVGTIYLPMVRSRTLQAVSEFEDIEIGFPDEVVAGNSAFEGVSITVPAGSLFADDGTRGGSVGIAPVDPDRLPGTLPPGLEFSIVITVQTDGPTNFDQPAPVRFPNLPDPATGETLPPGAKTALWSFNHDTGFWEVVGMMTVSGDGLYVDSDPGSGILAPGWHGARGGSPGRGPLQRKYDPKRRDDPDPEWEREKEEGDCQKEIICTETLEGNNHAFCLLDCSNNLLSETLGKIWGGGERPKAESTELGLCAGNALTCKDQWESVEDVVGGDRWDDALTSEQKGCMDNCMAPGTLQFPMIVPCEGFFDPCPQDQGFSYEDYTFFMQADVGLVIPPDWLAEQKGLWKAEADYFSLVFGTEKIAQTDPLELSLLRAFFNAFDDRVESGSEDGIGLSETERAELLALQRVSQFEEAEWVALIDRIELMRNNALPSDQFDEATVEVAAQHVLDVTQLLLDRGWERRMDGMINGLARLSYEKAPVVGSDEFPARGHYYYIKNFETGFERRGRLSSTGTLEGVIFAQDQYHIIAYVDPITLNIGVATFFTSGPGNTTYVPTARLSPSTSADSDNDGLSDHVEKVVGTLADNPDSDDDGVPDGAELRNGSDPLDGIPVGAGIIASLDTPGEATGITVIGEIAALADGGKGVALIDVSNPFSPLTLSEIRLSGIAEMVAGAENKLIVGLDNNQLAVVDITNPAEPTVAHMVAVSGSVNGVEASGSYGYVGLGNNRVLKINLDNGTVVWEWLADSPVGEISLSRGNIYAVTSNSLQIIEDAPQNPVLVGSVPVEGAINPQTKGRSLFVGGDYAYVGYWDSYSVVDISDPTQPVVVGVPPQRLLAMHGIVATGSGLTLGATEVNFVELQDWILTVYDGSDPAVVIQLVAQFVTPGKATDLALYKGMVLVADMQSGMQVVNFLGVDTEEIPPQASLETGFSLNPPEAETNQPTWVYVDASDDVQVRDVELYIDGELASLDGNYPFEFNFVVPSLTATKTRFTIQAKASDTGGSSTWTDLVEVNVVDTTPPVLFDAEPLNGAVLLAGTVTELSVLLNEQPDLATLSSVSFYLLEAGPDETPNTGDDIQINGLVEFNPDTLKATLTLTSALEKGRYTVVLSNQIADPFGNSLAEAFGWTFEVSDSNRWIAPSGGNWSEPASWSKGAVPNQDFVFIDVPEANAPTVVSSGTVSIASFLTEEDFTLSGGTLNVAEDSMVKGLFTWTSQSTLGGGGTTFAEGGMLIDGFFNHSLGDHWLINNGLGQWTEGNITLSDSNALILNSAGATLELLNETFFSMVPSTGLNPLGFINEGMVIKRSAGGSRFANLPIENLGTIDIKLGELELLGGQYFGNGSIVMRSGTTLTFRNNSGFSERSSKLGGSLVLEENASMIWWEGRVVTQPGSEITGDGSVISSGSSSSILEVFGSYDVGSTIINGGTKASFHSFARTESAQLDGSSTELGGSGIFESTGEFLWTGGVMSGGGTTRIRGTLQIDTPNQVSLKNRTLEIFGEAIGASGKFLGPDGFSRVRIDVKPGGTWRQIDNFTINGDPTNKDWLFSNAGTFVKEGDPDSRFNMDLVNSGLLRVDAGKLIITGLYSQTAGETRLSESKLEVQTYEDEILVLGGLITGSGELGIDPGTVFILIDNLGGEMSPGTDQSAGRLAMRGAYLQGNAAVLAIDIFGSAQTEGAWDRVSATRSIELAGNLEIRIAQGFTPDIGEIYTLIEGQSRTGEFETVTGLEIASDRRFEVVYTDTGVQAKVVAVP